MRPVFDWNIGSRSLPLGKRTLVMGIVNVTPDSFSDGGQFLDPGKAVSHAIQLLNDGADIIDVGGESTRPGASVAGSTANKKTDAASAVSEKEELERVLPVIQELKQQRPNAVISIDTYKANVARAAVTAGAEIVNDVSAFPLGPGDGEYRRRTQVRSCSDAHARAAGRVAHARARVGHRCACET